MAIMSTGICYVLDDIWSFQLMWETDKIEKKKLCQSPFQPVNLNKTNVKWYKYGIKNQRLS